MSSVGSSGGPSGGPSGQAARWSERLGAATDRIGRWCDHWITALGIPAVLVIGASILLFGLGANGLWDPWEMDRAAVARTFHERPEISAAVATNGDESTALKDALLAAAEDAGFGEQVYYGGYDGSEFVPGISSDLLGVVTKGLPRSCAT